MNAPALVPAFNEKRLLAFSAWGTIPLISDVPDIACKAISGQVPESMPWIKAGVMALLFGLCLVWRRIHRLRQFVTVMLVFCLALAVSNWVGKTHWWTSRFGGPLVSFAVGYCGVYIRDSGVAFAVIATLWLIKRRRSEFFLVKGQLDAPIGPVPWLGIRQGESWRTFGWIFAIIASIAVLIPTAVGLRLTSEVLLRAIPLVLSGILFAAINAFNEEVYFRASLLSTLPEVIGKTHALLINAVFFGLAHYLYGSPSGVIGFLMTAFLAWLLGKSMLETKGFTWPWFIHFLPDVVVFASYAVLWVESH